MKNSEALYATIYNHLLENIRNNCYANGEKLPTEMELAKEFYVSRITSKKALNALAEQGIIVRIPGRGSFQKENCKIPVKQHACILQGKYIALVMGGYSSSFGLDIINGAMDTASKLGLHLIIKATYSSQDIEAKTIQSLMSAGVSGIIVQPSQGELYSEVIIKAIYDGLPIVMIDRNMKGINAPFVGVNNRYLSKIATEQLIARNHRNIALVSLVNDKSSTINERMTGFTDAFVDNMLVVNKGLWLTDLATSLRQSGLTTEHPDAYEFFVSEIAKHLELHPEITSIFGTEYFVSRAAFEAAKRIGRHIPNDLSIVSFDTDSSYVGSHSMSHIKQPQREMGIKSVELLYEIMQHRPPTEQQFLLPGIWVDGLSVQEANKQSI